MKKKPTKKAAKKTVDLNTLEYADGVNHDLDKIRDLEELLDMKQANPYGTLSEEIFKEEVALMTMQQMGNLASRVGVQLTNRESILRERLIESFKIWKRRHRAVIGGVDLTRAKQDDAVYKDIQELLQFPKRGSR